MPWLLEQNMLPCSPLVVSSHAHSFGFVISDISLTDFSCHPSKIKVSGLLYVLLEALKDNIWNAKLRQKCLQFLTHLWHLPPSVQPFPSLFGLCFIVGIWSGRDTAGDSSPVGPRRHGVHEGAWPAQHHHIRLSVLQLLQQQSSRCVQ